MAQNNTCYWIGAGKAGPERDARDSVAVHTAAGTRKHLSTVAGTRQTREQFGFGFFCVGPGFLPTPHHPLPPTQLFCFVLFSPSCPFYMRSPVSKCAQSTKLLSTHLDLWKVLSEIRLGVRFLKVGSPGHPHQHHGQRCLLTVTKGS